MQVRRLTWGLRRAIMTWCDARVRGMHLLHVRPGNIQKLMYINLARQTGRRALIQSELATLEIAEENITRIEPIYAANCG